MTTIDVLEQQLLSAVAPHDLLQHPYYQAWTMGTLTLADLRAYAAQYRYQVEALPGLLRAAHESAGDAEARAALLRNLEEEEGAAGHAAHRELWLRFVEGLGAQRGETLATAESKATRAACAELRETVGQGEIEALAALWAYELQTARVAKTKRSGLAERYGMSDERAVSFFALHEELDVHHAAELLSALGRACARAPDGEARATKAAAGAARAQWHFLDGVEEQRAAAA